MKPWLPKLDRAVLVIAIAILIWSLLLSVRSPRHEDPELTWRLATIVTRLAGASAERIEADVSAILEDYVREVDEVKTVTSVSRRGVSLLQVELIDQVVDAPPVWQKVRHALEQAEAELPQDVVGPELDDEVMGTATWLIGISAQDRSLVDLQEFADRLEELLRFMPFVAETTLFGDQTEVVYVTVDPPRLAAHQLAFDSVAEALVRQSPATRSGTIATTSQQISIDATAEFDELREIEEAFLDWRSPHGALRLRDVARVTYETIDPADPLVRVGGVPSVLIVVRAHRRRGSEANAERLNAVVERFAENLPDDVTCRIVHDEARYTSHRMRQLSATLGFAMLLVFISCSLFMGWRGGVVVAAAIPITGLLSVAILYCLDVSLQQMSVMGIIMSFGLLVDDAIIIVESMQHQIREGISPTRAARQSVREFWMPMLITTLTTVAAFIPIAMLAGGTGEFVRSIPISVGTCLLTALVVSMTVVPWLLAATSSRTHRGNRDWFEWLLGKYKGGLLGMLRRPAVVMVCIPAIFIALGLSGLDVRRDFFSPVERDQFVIDVFTDPGSSLAHTSRIASQIETALLADREVTGVLCTVGRNVPQVFYNLYNQETYAEDFAQFVVTVDDFAATASIARRIQQELNRDIAEAMCTARILEHGPPLTAPFEVRCTGASLEVIQEVSSRVVAMLKDAAGVRNVRSNSGWTIPQLHFDVIEPLANRVGATHDQIADFLRHSTDGIVAGYLRTAEERTPVHVRFPQDSRTMQGLAALPLKVSETGQWIPLSGVARPRTEWEMSRIYRRDGLRTQTVTAYPEFGLSAADVARRFQPELGRIAANLPKGYSLTLGGENEQRERAESALAQNSVFAVLMVVCLLIVALKRVRLVAIVLMLIPMSFCGAVFGLWLTGWPLNFMALMGMLMLAGILVNDAVVLIHGYQRRRQNDHSVPVDTIIVEGTLGRSRHIVVTTMTTVMGLVPLALSPSLLWPPLAIVIIFGLLASTPLTLVLVPVTCRKFVPGQLKLN